MSTRIAAASLGALVAAVASLALFGGSASAVLPGPGGGEPLSCSFASHTTWTQGDGGIGATSVTGIPCWGNIVGFYMSLSGSTCSNTTYQAYVFKSGDSNYWFYGHGYCADGTWNYSNYYSGGNATQGEQLNLQTTCLRCTSTVYYGVKVWKQ